MRSKDLMTKQVSIKFLTIAIFCLMLTANNVFAQSQASTGQITGVVADSTGAVVPNAAVTLVSKDTNRTQEVTTSDDGVYRFVLLQPGTYSVKTSSSGFGEQTLDVEVQVGRTTDANFTLGAGNVSATVEVTAEGVQTTSSNSDAVLNETAIQNLPINGRRFQDFATLTPTAQIDPSRGQISLSGQRGINTNVNVDGVDFNQPFFGGIRGGERSNSSFTIPQESIREFNVVAAGYSAEFGRSSGGIINVVTKSGTNNLRGSAFYLLRPRQLARANAYAKALQEQRLSQIVINGQTGVDATLAPTQQQFGGSIGGPIVNDKLFYFGSYEQQRFRAPRQILYPLLVGLTPTAAQTEVFNFYRAQEVPFTQTNDAYAGLGKIDWQVNEANRFNIRFNYSRNNAINGASTGETSFDPTTSRALGTNGTEKDRNLSTVGQLISNFGATAINELRFQYAREDRPREANEISPNVFTGIGEFGTRNFLPTTQFDTRYQVTDAITFLAGNHTFKFGGEYSRIFAEQVFGFGQTGEYSLTGQSTANTLALLGTTPVIPTAPATNTFLGRFDATQAIYRQQIGNLQATIKVQELSFFAQDAWRVTPKLTVNYGLRAEQQYNPDPDISNTDLVNLVRNAQFPRNGNKGFDPSQIPDSGWQFGPRLGFAYDPAGDGKTVVRGFAGVYYARTPLLLLADSINNYRLPPGNVRAILGSGGVGVNQAAFNTFLGTPAGQPYRQITGCNPTGTAVQIALCTPNTIYRQFAILGINLNSSPINRLPTLTPAQVQQIATTLNPTFNPNIVSGIAVTGTDPDFKNPQSFQFGFGVEREIASNFIIGIDYSQVKTSFLQRNVDLNLPAPIFLDPSIDPAQRPYFGITRPAFVPTSIAVRPRPVAQLSNVQVRESSAKSLFRSLTFRTRVVRKWGQLNAYYTLSRNSSDDDNERDAGGVLFTNPYNLSNEYGPSRLDRTHQFVASPIFFLPYGFEASSTVRLRSGSPINTIVNTDLNGDGLNNDRPYLVAGVELPRNYYRNRPVYDIDLRVQKGFNFSERRRLIFSAEFFNIFNLSNIQISGVGTTAFCQGAAATLNRCGLDGSNNLNFLQVKEQNPTNVNFGKIITSNNPGSQVFQMQLGARFQF
jgi:Carboxypeptidase regulatory-like domain